MKKKKTYTEHQLVNFGYYLLSEQRTRLIKDNHKSDPENAVRQVYDADIRNFEHIYELSKQIKP